MTKTGLVFSGGGGKGAYEIGAWKAFREYGFDQNIAAVAGTSVGALNGALFVHGDYEAAETLWKSISNDNILALNTYELHKDAAIAAATILLRNNVYGNALLALTKLNKPQGYFDRSGIRYMIVNSNASDSASQSELPFYVCALEGLVGQLVYNRMNQLPAAQIQEWLLASSAIPAIFGPVEIEGKQYYDGGVIPGFSDNTPFKPLIEEQGCTHIINIFLERDPALLNVQKQYGKVKFWNIVPTRDFDGLISPLNFDADNAAKLIEQGYQDVKRILEQFKDFIDDEERYMEAVFELANDNKDFQQAIEINRDIRESRAEPAAYEKVMEKLAVTITQQERTLMDQGIESLVDEMQTNSNALLEDAFSSITSLATTEGQINHQQEQGHIKRFLGAITGKNQQAQAQINWDLNRAIYASQLLIQKLNHKNMLTMEAMVALANKTTYLMNHVNMLYAGQKVLEQQQLQALQLMQQAMESLTYACWQRFREHDQRLEALERLHLVDNWYHHARLAKGKGADAMILLQTTASFYNATGRAWNDNELHRYINALDDVGIANLTVNPLTLLNNKSVEEFFGEVGSENVLPIKPGEEQHYPLLKAMQVSYERPAFDTNQEIDNHYLSLDIERTAVELGLELLHSLRQNDKRPPDNRHGLKTQYLKAIEQLLSINETLGIESTVKKDLEYLNQQIAAFKVVVPVIGKFSSGKSTLLNKYLGHEYLACDVLPKTSFATELHYSTDEHVLLHYTDDHVPQRLPLASLATIEPEETLYYAQAFINNRRLKNRSDLVIVDMPGFDSTLDAHHKAIACYLERGDYFVSLMPANDPFDASIIEKLHEIRINYNKEIACLISISDEKGPNELPGIKQKLTQMLKETIGEDYFIGEIGRSTALKDFEEQMDSSVRNIDALLEQRYAQSIYNTLEHLEHDIQTVKKGSVSGEVELEIQIQQTREAFEQLKKRLNSHLNKMEFNLCSEGKEKLIVQAESALRGSLSRLVSAAKGNTLPSTLTDILRPVLQGELAQLIDREMERLEMQLQQDSTLNVSMVNVPIEIPLEIKEKFSMQYAVIAAGIGALFLGPIGVGIVGLLAGLFGRKHNAEERENQIQQQISNSVIPQAVSQVTEQISGQLLAATEKLRQQLMAKLGEEETACNKRLKQLQLEKAKTQEEFAEKQQALTENLSALAILKVKLIDGFDGPNNDHTIEMKKLDIKEFA